MREQADRVRGLPLPSVLRAAGARPDRADPAKWHTDRGVISLTGPKFYNWTRATGGGGAIDLVMHLNGLDFRSAVAWLKERFPAGASGPRPSSKPSSNLRLPRPAANQLEPVKQYLAVQRRLAPSLIDRLIGSGDLYADARANAVFLLRDKAHVRVGAELRGTGCEAWRGMAPGSRKNRGYFSICNALTDQIVLCESAIDAISCFALHPASWCISAAGACPAPAWLPALVRTGLPVFCGYDADPVGEQMALAMTNKHPAIERLRPSKQDWNDVLKSLG
jgi:hypothetical protein